MDFCELKVSLVYIVRSCLENIWLCICLYGVLTWVALEMYTWAAKLDCLVVLFFFLRYPVLISIETTLTYAPPPTDTVCLFWGWIFWLSWDWNLRVVQTVGRDSCLPLGTQSQTFLREMLKLRSTVWDRMMRQFGYPSPDSLLTSDLNRWPFSTQNPNCSQARKDEIAVTRPPADEWAYPFIYMNIDVSRVFISGSTQCPALSGPVHVHWLLHQALPKLLYLAGLPDCLSMVLDLGVWLQRSSSLEWRVCAWTARRF